MSSTVSRRSSSSLQSVERACAVLEYLASCDVPQTATQVSQALGIERTATHRLLKSLLTGGLVRSDRPGIYSIGPRALAIGLSYVEQMLVWQLALPYLMELSLECADRPWTIVLAMFDGRDILLLERLWTRLTPLDTVIEIGGKMPVDRTAAGWAYLAQLSDNEGAEIVGEERFEQIRPKIASARKSQGMSFASGELQPGVDALSAPILDANGRPVALLIVGGIDFGDELHLESRTATRVLRIVSRVSATLSSRH
jgi:IclR family transcriptional regulator, acetate operon repressor